MVCVKRGFAIILGILAGVLLLTALAGVLCMNYNLAQIALVEHIEADIEEQVVVVDSVISHQQGLVFNAVECISISAICIAAGTLLLTLLGIWNAFWIW